MAKVNYKITLEGATEKEADAKMQALTVIAKKLSAKELLKLADIIQNDPVKTAMAKQALGV